MDKKTMLSELLTKYKQWVIKNPGFVTEMETVATWTSYFVAGKINKSPIVSELVYSISKLVSLFNDSLIRDAYESEIQYYSLREQIKLWLTIVHYCEVFVELVVKNKWGTRGKWTAATFLQLFKCSSALVLLYRFKEVPVHHPPIPALQRKKIVENKQSVEKSNDFFTLKRSGRIIRCVDGAPPAALRDWQPVKIKDDKKNCSTEINDIVCAELLHTIKPVIHLGAMRVFGTQTWKQWLIALSLDLASFKLYNRHMKELSHEQRLEISRRKLSLLLYLLRSPMYKAYSKNIIGSVLSSASNTVPLFSYISGPLVQYIDYFQDIYFYMWAS